MWPLLKDLFTNQNAFVRFLRLVLVAVGMAFSQGLVLPEKYSWVGFLVAGFGAIATGGKNYEKYVKKEI